MNFLLDFSRSHILKVKICEIKCITILCLSNIQNKVLTCNLFLVFYNLYFLVPMYGVLPTCISVYYMHGVPEQAREQIRPAGTRARYSWELPCGCWGLNLGPSKEQPGL